MLNFVVMLQGKFFLLIEFTHKVAILLCVWRHKPAGDLMTALTGHCDISYLNTYACKIFLFDVYSSNINILMTNFLSFFAMYVEKYQVGSP